jgi:heavy metal sensor kinase
VSLSIRTRLTLSYAAILLVILLILGIVVDAGVQAAIHAGVDYDLQIRRQGLESFLRDRVRRFPRERLNHQFSEHSALRPGGDTFQVSDQSGWIYQSENIRSLHLPMEHGGSPAGPVTRVLANIPVRVLAAVVQVNGRLYYVQLATTLSVPYLAMDRFRRLMLALIPVMLLAASAGGFWQSRRALAPVDRIIEEARSITLQNISRRLPVPPTKDELQRLAHTLNDMMERLELAFQRIVQFTADASHELRAPIALIRGTAEVALLEPRDVKSYRAALSDILTEAERTTRLIENLLALARADAGSSQPALVAIDLTEQLRTVCRQGALLAGTKRIRFSERIPQAGAPALGDADTVRRLFFTLIDNAVKYTPPGGLVEVELAVGPSQTEVTVRDSGIGMADEDLDRIFERFYRADKARQRDSGGVGLGLSIARWIADAHSAEIQVESKLNSGSTFRVLFPKPEFASSRHGRI